jgi:hypothetical protein
MVLGIQVNSRKGKAGRKAGHNQPALSGIALSRLTDRSGLGFGSGSASSSDAVGHSFISTNSFGYRTLRQEVLLSAAIQVRQDQDQHEYQHYHDSISPDEHAKLAQIRADEDYTDQDDFSQANIHDILAGDATAEVSHAGGEFAELLAIEDGLLGPVSRYACTFTTRSCTNTTPEGSKLPTTEPAVIVRNAVQLPLSFKLKHLLTRIWHGWSI